MRVSSSMAVTVAISPEWHQYDGGVVGFWPFGLSIFKEEEENEGGEREF